LNFDHPVQPREEPKAVAPVQQEETDEAMHEKRKTVNLNFMLAEKQEDTLTLNLNHAPVPASEKPRYEPSSYTPTINKKQKESPLDAELQEQIEWLRNVDKMDLAPPKDEYEEFLEQKTVETSKPKAVVEEERVVVKGAKAEEESEQRKTKTNGSVRAKKEKNPTLEEKASVPLDDLEALLVELKITSPEGDIIQGIESEEEEEDEEGDEVEDEEKESDYVEIAEEEVEGNQKSANGVGNGAKKKGELKVSTDSTASNDEWKGKVTDQISFLTEELLRNQELVLKLKHQLDEEVLLRKELEMWRKTQEMEMEYLKLELRSDRHGKS